MSTHVRSPIYHLFHKLNLGIFQGEYLVGTLCVQLFLQFYVDYFETK